jgi:hypothetical protein
LFIIDPVLSSSTVQNALKNTQSFLNKCSGAESMAYRYTNVRLVDFDNPVYREFIAPFLLARAMHKGGPVPARARFGQQVEAALRGWLETHTTLLPQRVLGYTQVGGGSARPNYRELDAVEPIGEHGVVVYEFKTSRSPASLYRGLAQLNKSRQILSNIFRQVTGVLFFVYTDPETLVDLRQAIADIDYASPLADWADRHQLETPLGVLLWPVARVVEIAGEEDLILDWEDEEGKEHLIEWEEEPWQEDWRTYQAEEKAAEPLGTLGAALLAALSDPQEEES